jgi:hypothetical protein
MYYTTRKYSGTLGVSLPLDMRQDPGTNFLGDAGWWQKGGFLDQVATNVTQAWENRPEVLKKIRIRIKPQQVLKQVSQLVPPAQAARSVDYARSLGFDPSLLTNYGEVPITGSTVYGGYQAGMIDWQKSLPWIIGIGAAVVILPMALRGRR